MRARARRRRLLLQRRERGRARGAVARSPSRAGRTAPVSLRVNPDVDAEDASLHLDRPAGQQVRHRARATRCAAYRRAARAARASRWSASTATSARRSPTSSRTSTRSTALLDLVEAVEARRHRARRTSTSAAASASPTPTRRRPTADALVGAPARAHRRARPRRTARSCSSRAARWSATPACCVTEVLYLKPGEAEELLHRRRGDERPDAPGDVRRLDAASSPCRRATRAPARCDVVGPVCESGDWLGPRPPARGARRATSSPCCRPAPTA